MTRIEKQIYDALKQRTVTIETVRDLYWKAITSSSRVYSLIDFEALDSAIIKKFSAKRFRELAKQAIRGK